MGPVAKKLDLTYDYGQGKKWWPIEKEVDRLAQCAFLVYWYPGANPGQSAGVMTGVAAQRPILLNRNRMFNSLIPYSPELYFSDDLEGGMRQVMDDLEHQRERIPITLKKERSWEALLPIMVERWVRG